VLRLGFGMPAFNSDEVIIPSFIEKGVKKEDAYNYSAIGCVEVAVPGKWGYRCTGMSFLNFPKSLLIAMNDGVPLYVELPASVVLEVTYTEPGLQGDRSTGGTKPATVETGAEIQVPLFLEAGTKVKIDTRTGDYLGRVND
jgi:hypothetical protein